MWLIYWTVPEPKVGRIKVQQSVRHCITYKRWCFVFPFLEWHSIEYISRNCALSLNASLHRKPTLHHPNRWVIGGMSHRAESWKWILVNASRPLHVIMDVQLWILVHLFRWIAKMYWHHVSAICIDMLKSFRNHTRNIWKIKVVQYRIFFERGKFYLWCSFSLVWFFKYYCVKLFTSIHAALTY